mgnify:CR=1 FL=1
MAIEVSMLDADLEMMTREFDIIYALPLVNVFQVVGKRSQQEGYNELRRDIEEKGIKNQIIIIENTFENYNLAIRRVTKRFVRQYINAHRTYLCMYCLLYTSPSPRDLSTSRMPSSA